jgi:hypothetical protein
MRLRCCYDSAFTSNLGRARQARFAPGGLLGQFLEGDGDLEWVGEDDPVFQD